MISYIIILISLLGAAFFAGTETSFIALLRQKSTKERMPTSVELWLNNPENILSVTLVGTNICQIILSSVAASVFIDRFGQTGALYSLISVTLATIIFCEVLPKSQALASPESFARVTVLPLNISGIVLKPLSMIVSKLSRMAAKIVGKVVKPTSPPSWAEFELVAKNGQLKLGSSRHAMLKLMFEIEKKTTFDIMIPRSSLATVQLNTGIGEIRTIYSEQGENLIPVRKGDRIIGVIDYIDMVTTEKTSVREALIEPLFVPENAPLLKVFSEMIDSNINYALVVDEYGTVTGGISHRKLSSILSGRRDESLQNRMTRLPTGSIVVDGSISIENLSFLLETEIPKGPYRTAAGFIEEISHGIPDEAAGLFWREWEFTVTGRTSRRITRIRIDPAVKKKPA